MWHHETNTRLEISKLYFLFLSKEVDLTLSFSPRFEQVNVLFFFKVFRGDSE